MITLDREQYKGTYDSFDCTTNNITNEYIHVRILQARWCK